MGKGPGEEEPQGGGQYPSILFLEQILSVAISDTAIFSVGYNLTVRFTYSCNLTRDSFSFYKDSWEAT